MPHVELIHVIIGLRVGVAVEWAMIGYFAAGPMYRVVIGQFGRGDLGWASLFMIAVGLLIFQWRALAGFTPAIADPFVATALLSFMLSGIGVFIARALRAPEGHQRAALLSHLVVIAGCMVAGLLS